MSYIYPKHSNQSERGLSPHGRKAGLGQLPGSWRGAHSPAVSPPCGSSVGLTPACREQAPFCLETLDCLSGLWTPCHLWFTGIVYTHWQAFPLPKSKSFSLYGNHSGCLQIVWLFPSQAPGKTTTVPSLQVSTAMFLSLTNEIQEEGTHVTSTWTFEELVCGLPQSLFLCFCMSGIFSA